MGGWDDLTGAAKTLGAKATGVDDVEGVDTEDAANDSWVLIVEASSKGHNGSP
jgi:hypothetical protein